MHQPVKSKHFQQLLEFLLVHVQGLYLSHVSSSLDTSDEEDSTTNVQKRGEDFSVLLQKSGKSL